MIKIKRIYLSHGDDDGYRVLVDRLWPRGIKKEKANIDLWLKDVAPSHSLRKWFGHDPNKWGVFKSKYRAELKNDTETLKTLRNLKKEKKVITLLYSAKDEQHNNAVVLQEVLNNRFKKGI